MYREREAAKHIIKKFVGSVFQLAVMRGHAAAVVYGYKNTLCRQYRVRATSCDNQLFDLPIFSEWAYQACTHAPQPERMSPAYSVHTPPTRLALLHTIIKENLDQRLEIYPAPRVSPLSIVLLLHTSEFTTREVPQRMTDCFCSHLKPLQDAVAARRLGVSFGSF